MPAKASPKPFQMIAGHPALDLVNSLDNRFAEVGPLELLATYDDLLRFVSQAALITERQCRELRNFDLSSEKRETALGKAIQLRETLAAVIYGLLDHKQLPSRSLDDLESILKDAAKYRKLVLKEAVSAELRPALTWEYTRITREVGSPVWLLAQAASDLLTSAQTNRIRQCGSEACKWLFLDTSKNHTRRWCDMKICGNRHKARRFQLRQTAG